MTVTATASTTFTPTGFQALKWDEAIWMRYRQACWLLRNLIANNLCTPQDAERARLHVAERLGWPYAIDEHPLGQPLKQEIPAASRSYWGIISCETCGNPYGRKVWHATTQHVAYVFECPRNYRKSGTCATPHIYQEHLISRANLLIQKLCRRSGTAKIVSAALPHPETVRAVKRLLAAPPEQVTFNLKEFLGKLAHATVTTEHTIIAELRHGTPIAIPFEPRWAPRHGRMHASPNARANALPHRPTKPGERGTLQFQMDQ